MPHRPPIEGEFEVIKTEDTPNPGGNPYWDTRKPGYKPTSKDGFEESSSSTYKKNRAVLGVAGSLLVKGALLYLRYRSFRR